MRRLQLAYMPRITVYLSDDLRQRMDRADPAPNWSQVAARAFEVELTQLEEKAAAGAEDERAALIARLRRAMLSESDPERAARFRKGQQFALREVETPSQVRAVARWKDVKEPVVARVDQLDGGTVAEMAYAALHGRAFAYGAEDGDRVLRFWRDRLGGTDGWDRGVVPQREMVRDFMDGVEHVLQDVRAALGM